jgi:hypothetical protein
MEQINTFIVWFSLRLYITFKFQLIWIQNSDNLYSSFKITYIITYIMVYKWVTEKYVCVNLIFFFFFVKFRTENFAMKYTALKIVTSCKVVKHENNIVLRQSI